MKITGPYLPTALHDAQNKIVSLKKFHFELYEREVHDLDLRQIQKMAIN